MLSMLIRSSPVHSLPRDTPFVVSADRPLALLKQCPAYRATPMRVSPELARRHAVARIWIKDESQRMNLGSFKALGGAFAVAQIVREASGCDDLAAPAARETAAGMTFVTASAGNHGLSVAAGARIFGAKAVIVLASNVPESFADRIRKAGADVVRIDGSYEQSVAYADEQARTRGWLHLADGSWDGYVERPALVMEGYTVLAEECRHYFEMSDDWPSHVFVQAGVGGLAAAVAAHIRSFWAKQPEIVVVEPAAAPCLLKSVEAGRLVRVEGPVSNMGRLDCKDASLIAFDTLRANADVFMTVSDEQASDAAAEMAATGLATTPSGAAGLAALAEYAPGDNARCLIVATEGPEGG